MYNGPPLVLGVEAVMTRWILALSAILLTLASACDPPAVDNDRDGYVPGDDCDDEDAAINPGAEEICDGIDNNCDGSIDEGVMISFYADSDDDGFGDVENEVFACELGEGMSENPDDCDDLDPEVNPAFEEICDEKDNNCDTVIDEGVELTFYEDNDRDGFGDADHPVLACALFEGVVDNAADCDDAMESVNPEADEVCDTIDNNCDSFIDEDTAVDAGTWYRDSDVDGFGNALDAVVSCEAPVGYIADDTDCDDAEPNAYPGNTELCDGIDNNCDTVIDEDTAFDARTWYADTDDDGFGVDTTTVVQCYDPGDNWVDVADDCDDTVATTYPGADEYCNGADDDCDTVVDETDALDAKTWYRDSDGDSYGDTGSSTRACEAPSGYVADMTDCDDSDRTEYPGADEYCDGDDDDCDTVIDEDDSVDAKTWYRDSDRDSYGDETSSRDACYAPAGYVADKTDCDDSDGTEYPGADEYCDGDDDDCDTVIDEDDAVDAITWYVDGDGDGYGDSSTSTKACAAPGGYVADSTDCDDTDSTINPSTKWYYDADLDGYGVSSSFRTQCLDPGTYYVSIDGDCEPSDAKSYPGAPEICLAGTSAEGKDNDCDTVIDEECPDIHCGTISADETWADNTYGHLVTCNTYVQGTSSPVLTIDPGAEVKFNASTGLWVGWSADGDIDIAGTSTKPVSFTSNDPRPSKGDYYGLILGSRAKGSYVSGLEIEYAGLSASYPGAVYINSNDTPLDDVLVSNSGQNGIYITGGAPEISNSTVTDSALAGVYCGSETCLDPTDGGFANNTLTKNGDVPIRLWASQVDYLAESSSYTGNIDDNILVYGGTVSRDATWHDLGIPYRIDNNVYVQDTTYAPVLTLDDGVDLVFDTSTGLWVGQSQSGDLIIDGSASDGVSMTSGRPKPGRGDWYGLILGYYTSSTTDLNYLEIAHGGQSSSYPGNISMYAPSTPKLRNLDVYMSDRHGIYASSNAEVDLADSEIHDNDDYGLYLENAAVLTNTLSGSDITSNNWPIRLSYEYAHLLDTTSSYDGNTNDYAEIVYNAWLESSVTWKAIDVPFYSSNHIYVGKSSGSAVLTLDDGVVLKMRSRYGIWVGYSGRNGDLVIKGDHAAGKGVVIESYTGGGPGTWYGLILERGTSSVTDLAGFTLRDAGYASSWAGGIHVAYGTVAMSDCIIEDNERWGLYVLSSSSSVYADLDVSDCVIRDTTTTNSSSLPDGDGIYLNNNEYHAIALDDVTLTGNGRYPISLHANQMTAIDAKAAGSSYTGNGVDKIFVHGGFVRASGTWQDPGIPYLIAAHTYLRNTSTTPAYITTTGTTFEMGLGVGMMVGFGDYGDLSATSATFTSTRSTKLAGDWCGLDFNQYSSSLSKLDKVTVEYGGKTSGCPYSSTWYGNVHTYRSPLTITGSTIRHSASTGVDFYYSSSASVTGSTISNNATYGVECRFSTGATVSGNTYSSNSSGNTSGC